VRALFDDHGQRLECALPSSPVEILGLDAVPRAGDKVNVVAKDDVARQVVEYRKTKAREAVLASQKKTTLEDILSKMAEDSLDTKELPIVLKGDTQGSVEAIVAAIEKLNTEKVHNRVIHSGVGGINENDVNLAKTSTALVIGFNVRAEKVAAQVAEQDGVMIRYFSIIYELIDEVKQAMAGRLDPIRVEKVLGQAEIRSVFSIPKIGTIAGSIVSSGKVVRNCMVRVVREGVVIFTSKVSSLKRFKDDAREVLQGYECGIGVDNYNDLKLDDVLEFFEIEQVAATLD